MCEARAELQQKGTDDDDDDDDEGRGELAHMRAGARTREEQREKRRKKESSRRLRTPFLSPLSCCTGCCCSQGRGSNVKQKSIEQGSQTQADRQARCSA